MSESGDWRPLTVDEAVEELTDAGLLTERQAEAYVRREIEAEPRAPAAAAMDTSKSNLDGLLGTARDKIAAAEATIEAEAELRHRPIPTHCDDCGAALGSMWIGLNNEAVCPECAGVDPEQLS